MGKEAALIRDFEEGLEAFRHRHWMKARECFQACLEAVPGDGPARLFLSRCDLFERDDPGPEWDGMTPAPE
jgi:adenylate cyclase